MNTTHRIYAFAEIKENWVKEKVGLKFPSGLPSCDMIRRGFGIIDPKCPQKLDKHWSFMPMGKARRARTKYSLEFKMGVIPDMRERGLSCPAAVRKHWGAGTRTETVFCRRTVLQVM